MAEIRLEVGHTVALSKPDLQQLLENLHGLGYETIGQMVRDEGVTLAPISNIAELPHGISSEQDAAHHRLIATGTDSYFGITHGSHTWKQFLFPPRKTLFSLQRDPKNPTRWIQITDTTATPRYAFIGVRPCDLAAIEIQDRVFMRSDLKDPIYRARRQNTFILVANCLHPSGTCFCASMKTGPKATTGFDLSLTELDDVYLIEIGSETGTMALSGLPWQPASAYLLQAAALGFEQARRHMGRELPEPDTLAPTLLNNLDHPHYNDVASRCLSCANCTQVCPTCFCWDTQENNSLSGEMVSKERVWDSCFNPEYSYVVGGSTRPNTRSRYRQWITHKLASWYQQFGMPGCVGCGRCITWCPAGIDITAEAAVLRKEN